MGNHFFSILSGLFLFACLFALRNCCVAKKKDNIKIQSFKGEFIFISNKLILTSRNQLFFGKPQLLFYYILRNNIDFCEALLSKLNEDIINQFSITYKQKWYFITLTKKYKLNELKRLHVSKLESGFTKAVSLFQFTFMILEK